MKYSKDTMLSLDEIGLLPCGNPSQIDTRTKINPFITDEYDDKLPKNHCDHAEEQKIGRLPVFVSPMTSVIDEHNIWMFECAGFIPVLPRKISFDERLKYAEEYWVSFSLQEFLRICDEDLAKGKDHLYILVDIANGHIAKLYDYAKRLKEKYPNVILMVGNIAHPDIYRHCCRAHIDYVRVGIGGGSVCSTSVQCGVHASLVWMIEEINNLKKREHFEFETKVIADGGINTLDRAIKCLALGYDYVMMGKLFAITNAACGEVRTHIKTHNDEDIYINYNIMEYEKPEEEDPKRDFKPNVYGDFKNATLERKYYGMASEQGQIDISGGACKNPEGIETWVPIEWTLSEFRAKFEAALRSTMSYVDATSLIEFIKSGDTQYAPMSKSEFNAYYK